MDYEKIFWKKQHLITIRNRTTDYADRKIAFNNKHITKIIKNQKPNTDIYITKYPIDKILNTIILDFDSEENTEKALQESNKLRNYLKTKQLNTIIISSGKKGYHTYTQIPPTAFSKKEFSTIPPEGYNEYFLTYVKELINSSAIVYETLDKVNFDAGLNGNIRLIGSKHPSTDNTCKIIKGTFKEFQPPNQYHLDCLKLAHKLYFKKKRKKEKELIERQKMVNKKLSEGFKDPVKENDLRNILPDLFPGLTKTFDKGYLYMQCPFHSDEHPSLLVTKEWYSCSACGEKGNIWTLRKKDYLNFDKEGLLI